MNMNYNFGAAALAALLAAAALSCAKLDVVGQGSIRSFDKLLQTTPDAVMPDAANGGWSLSAPDNSARFIWSKNYAESAHDLLLELDAAPFLAAGLNSELLPDNFAFNDGKLLVGTKLGQETLSYNGEPTPLASYEQIVKLKRNAVGYHGELDHYGVTLGDGTMFEWAKDMTTNDKDMVFVLNPEPFIKAGVDPNAIAGWVFTKVTVDDDNGKPIQVDKILKPFNILN